jgi:hypothetical protein
MNKRKNKLKKKKNTKQPPVLVRTCWSWNFHACWWGAEQGSHHGKWREGPSKQVTITTGKTLSDPTPRKDGGMERNQNHRPGRKEVPES